MYIRVEGACVEATEGALERPTASNSNERCGALLIEVYCELADEFGGMNVVPC